MSSIPSSTDYTIVIGLARDEKKFDRTLYDSAMTGGRASLEEVDQVLTQIENLFPKRSSWKTIGWTTLALALLPCFYIRACYDLSILQIYLLVVFLIMTLLFVLAGKSNINNNKEAYNQANMLLQRFQPSFDAKGLRWHVPKAFPNYVQLFKDYREDKLAQDIPYNPPSNQYNGEEELVQPLIHT